MIFVLLQFAICAGVIAVAGSALSRQGDAIASKSGISRSWIGLVLLATATSLPELFTGLSAVTLANAPNIAVGDALGSCLFNLVMVVLLDALNREEPFFTTADQGHILSAGFGAILIGFAGASLLIERETLLPTVWHFGFSTPLLILVYFFATRSSFLYQQRHGQQELSIDTYPDTTLGKAIRRYLLAAVFVVAAGIWLPFIGVEIADRLGLQATFVGTLMIAAATSVPELVVVISAYRMGATDLGMASLLGSNLFDILILGIDDIAYRDGPLLAAASTTHAVTAFAAVVMTGIVIVALLYQPRTRLAGTVGWASLALLAVYLFSSYVMFLHGH
ncbi:sodium:calcium antiporter [Methyloligella sp. 2.7D]|uniref:sodium:calcium antiporter n=1 Tax=unclassified Methyloligella TaxID=2625955 RepID=UPI00157D0047|nr:sodium:calcium antiporter [Methyloligella sp. GL2]QKP78098.1 sodium:calcium antiporter [Methyloligella sp. GL2]